MYITTSISYLETQINKNWDQTESKTEKARLPFNRSENLLCNIKLRLRIPML